MVHMFADLVIVFGRVIASSLLGPSKAVVVNLQAFEDGDSDPNGEGSTEEPVYGPFGVYGRPKPPVTADAATGTNPEGCAEFVGTRTPDGIQPLVWRDLRISKKMNPKEGEVGIAQYQGGFVGLKENADGNGTDITIYSVKNGSDGAPQKAHLLQFDSTDDNSSVMLLHSSGTCVTMNKDGQLVLAHNDGKGMISIDSDGKILLSGNVQHAGAMVVGLTAPPGPLPPEPVMLSTQLMFWIAQVNAAITALMTHTHIGAAPGSPTAPPVPPPVVPAAVPAFSIALKAPPA